MERVRSGFHRGSTRRILQYSNKFKRRGLRNRLFLYSHQRIALGQVILLDKCERPKLGNKAGADIRRHKYNLRGRRLEQYIEQCVPHRQAERQQFRDVCRSPGRNQRLRPNLRQLVAGHYSLGKHREFARDQHRVAATMGFVLHELVSQFWHHPVWHLSGGWERAGHHFTERHYPHQCRNVRQSRLVGRLFRRHHTVHWHEQCHRSRLLSTQRCSLFSGGVCGLRLFSVELDGFGGSADLRK